MTGQFSFLLCLRKCGKEFFEILNWLIMIQTDPMLHEDELSSAAKFFEEKKRRKYLHMSNSDDQTRNVSLNLIKTFFRQFVRIKLLGVFFLQW